MSSKKRTVQCAICYKEVANATIARVRGSLAWVCDPCMAAPPPPPVPTPPQISRTQPRRATLYRSRSTGTPGVEGTRKPPRKGQ